MKISIITICYNSEETIEDTIKSVVAQSHTDVEYIVVDGASKDSTMGIVEKYKQHIDTVISEPDKGIYDAMNKGVLAASGEVVGILNSDDFYAHSDVLKDIDKLFRRTEAEGIYADLVYVNRDDTNEVIRYWKSGPYKVG
ncbi:MAG: glycosyltransferase, partial [Bacteroidota bacterium]